MSAAAPALAAFRQLATEQLRFGYDQAPVVQEVTFCAGPGELLAIVGPNGCGKSTLLKLLIGVLAPGAGTVALDGRPLRAFGRIALARRLALVPQMAGGADMGAGDLAAAGFTVRQAVMMARYAAHVEEAPGLMKVAGGLGIFGFETAGDEACVRQAMWAADVHHLVERRVETLSGGERQRVAIARALAQETPALLLDEPTSALDLFHQLELVEQLRGLSRAGRLVILVTHDLNLALHCATRVIVMNQGRIAADGPPGDVLTPAVLEPVYQVRVKTGAASLGFERR